MSALICRRDALAMMGSAAAVASAAPAWSKAMLPPGGPSLDAIARRKGLRFGSSMGLGTQEKPRGFTDPRYRALMAAECGITTPENELKWSVIRQGGPATWDFEGADRLLAFAEANAMAFRGHTLLWNHPDYAPRWWESYEFGGRPAAEAERLMREHVTRVCGRYGGRIESYDVVNEAIDHKTGALRQTALSRAIGPERLIDVAFEAARAAAPHAELVYNDYMLWEPGGALHRSRVLQLLEGFRKRNVPVDALGIQAHIGDHDPDKGSAFGLHDERAWRAFLDRVTGMGYRLLITELDVSDKRLPADIAVRDAAVAEYCRAFLDVTLSYKQLRDVILWGIADRYSWHQGLTPRKDGLRKRPTPYDEDFRPKPLRDAIARAFAHAPER
ncbi:endo-1,4-beta-xylanase [Sphingosinicella sp. BN140058]|uniref:endo-1,4-beta-xylanase n=1 Tax=Sphingosinicella sp. BN140058 TaxID=1892855 RepID=UPI001010BDB1|nr:endo-1,4-beta-xylanase [Sphingosinicella sp. BN140058]QAY77065.1 glycosyl hydrolase [Sphingosinicella sp. BN140058]